MHASLLTVLLLAATADGELDQAFDVLTYRPGGQAIQVKVRRDAIAIRLKGHGARKLAEEQFSVDIGNTRVTLTLHEPSRRFEDMHLYRTKTPLDLKLQAELVRQLPRLKPGWINSAGPAAYMPNRRWQLLTRKLVVQFKPNISDELQRALHKRLGAKVIPRPRANKRRFTVVIGELPMVKAFRAYEKSKIVEFVEPVMGAPAPMASGTSSVCRPWHHRKLGAPEDADIDTPKAWLKTEGQTTVIALIDQSFKIDHSELQPNLWTNTGETAGDGDDNDGNDYIDDVNGFDFHHCTGVIEDHGFTHGTKVAGAAVCRGLNSHGIRGSAPQAKWMALIAWDNEEFAWALAYATKEGADVISTSRYFSKTSDILDEVASATTSGRGGAGCVLCYAMDWMTYSPDCATSISNIPEVLAVSWSAPDDAFVDFATPRAYGDCMSLLAPGEDIVTTSRNFETSACPYFHRAAKGTSFSAPMTAGVAALAVASDDTLQWDEVRRLLQDTCDKIQPSVGKYALASGFSSPPPTSPGGGQATHGYGRINAYEAVRTVWPVAGGGRGGRDLLLRDNIWDWGNTERPSTFVFEPVRGNIPYWESPDIKIDAGPAYQMFTPNSHNFDTVLVDENPEPSEACRVYVRVRNRGHKSVDSVKLRLFYIRGSELPEPFPQEYWTNPTATGVTTHWRFIGERTIASIPYSGCSQAGGPADAAVIRRIVWPVPAAPSSETFALLAYVVADQDPLQSDDSDLNSVVPNDNNITMRHIALRDFTLSAIVTPPLTLRSLREREWYVNAEGWRVRGAHRKRHKAGRLSASVAKSGVRIRADGEEQGAVRFYPGKRSPLPGRVEYQGVGVTYRQFSRESESPPSASTKQAAP